MVRWLSNGTYNHPESHGCNFPRGPEKKYTSKHPSNNQNLPSTAIRVSVQPRESYHVLKEEGIPSNSCCRRTLASTQDVTISPLPLNIATSVFNVLLNVVECLLVGRHDLHSCQHIASSLVQSPSRVAIISKRRRVWRWACN